MLTLPELGLYFSFLLFLVGLAGVMFRKNILFMMLSVEILLNAANLAFVSASRITGTIDGQVVMFFVMAVAACEAAVGLALIIALYRTKASIEADDLKALRG
ncbi:MAG: hypothetical protein RI932_2172 [Pseudomonadota bacterium]|jgi:NADH-quinone oxidoreductase subunit K